MAVARPHVRQLDIGRAFAGPRCSASAHWMRWSFHAWMCFSLALSTPACRSSRRLLKPKLCTLRLFDP